MPEYKYYMQAGPNSTFFTSNGYDVVYRRPDTSGIAADSIIRINMHFGQTDAYPDFVPGDSSSYVLNYYLPQADTNLSTGLRRYSSITAENIYPGISVTYMDKNPGIGIQFTIDTSQQPEVIELVFTGQDSVRLDTVSGILRIDTKLDPLLYTLPVAWQQSGLVDVTYDVDSINVVRFAVGSYRLDEELYIEIGQVEALTDQCEGNLAWSTYLGGESTNDLVHDIIIEPGSGSTDKLFVGGELGSPSIPNYTATGSVLAYVGVVDGFVAAFDVQEGANGLEHTMKWLTYYGSGGVDRVKAVEYGRSSSFMYASGEVAGSNLPLRKPNNDVYWNVQNNRRLFVARFVKSTGKLNWGTYFGGNDADEIHDMEMNQANEIYIVGRTESVNFPLLDLSDGSYYKGIPKTPGIAFVSIFDNDQGLLHSTCFGTSETAIHAIALNYEGSFSSSVYITGETNAGNTSDFLVKEVSTGFDNVTNSYGGGNLDAFITKFQPTTTAKFPLSWSSYIGGSDADAGLTIAIASEDVYVGGYTGSGDFPIEEDTSSGAFNQTAKYNQADGFIGRFTKQGEQLWTTYFGSDGIDEIRTILAHPQHEDIYFIGHQISPTGPRDISIASLSNAWNQPTPSSINKEVFIGWLMPDNRLNWSSYFGGDNDDEAYSGTRKAQDYFVIGGITKTSQDPRSSSVFPLCNPLDYYSVVQVQNNLNVEYGFLSNFEVRGLTTNVEIFGDQMEIKVFPTIADDWICIEMLVDNLTDYSYMLLNTIGQHVLVGAIHNSYQLVDVSSLPNGVYLLSIRSLAGVEST